MCRVLSHFKTFFTSVLIALSFIIFSLEFRPCLLMSVVNKLMKFDVTAAMKLKRDGPLVGLNVEFTLTEEKLLTTEYLLC